MTSANGYFKQFALRVVRLGKTTLTTLFSGILIAQSPLPADSRSTFAARWQSEAIAGPVIPQELALYLSYFPGDGEAVTETHLRFEPKELQISEVTSRAGAVSIGPGEVKISYTDSPFGFGATDTLQIALATSRLAADVPVEISITTTADTEKPAHMVRRGLAVLAPAALDVEFSPQHLVPNERTALELTVANVSDRTITGIRWHWPSELAVVDGASEWGEALEPGGKRTLSFDVEVSPTASRQIVLGGQIQAQGLHGSPLPEIFVPVMPAPRIRVWYEADFLELGETVAIQFTYYNPGLDTVRVEAVEVDVPKGFEGIRAALGSVVSGLVVGDAAEEFSILIDEPFELAPGAEFTMSLEAVPTRLGPFAWRSRFLPENATGFVDLEGEVTVNVIRSFDVDEEVPTVGQIATDLEAVSAALSERLLRELDDLALEPGSRIVLEAEQKKDDRTWLVDELITASLLENGYRVNVTGSDAGADAGNSVLSYRVVDARAVYNPTGVSWRSLLMRSSPQRREVSGDLFIQLRNSSSAARAGVVWARRISVFTADSVPGEGSRWLGDSEAIKRSTVAPDNKLLELGLSGLIATGLFLVFFAP